MFSSISWRFPDRSGAAFFVTTATSTASVWASNCGGCPRRCGKPAVACAHRGSAGSDLHDEPEALVGGDDGDDGGDASGPEQPDAASSEGRQHAAAAATSAQVGTSTPPKAQARVATTAAVAETWNMDPFRPLLVWLAPLWGHRLWPRWRLLLLLLHLSAVVAVACPAPVRTTTKKQWAKATVTVEIHAWTQRLTAFGIDVTEAELSDFAFSTSRRWSAARATLVSPFSTYLKTIGAPQGWYMFTAPDRSPQRFQVNLVHADGRVERVFTLGQSVARPDLIDPDFLAEHRIRRALFQTSWSERAVLFSDVCKWFERRLENRYTDLKEVTCSQIEFQVDHPAGVNKKAAEVNKKTVRVQRGAQPGQHATTEVRR